MFVVSERTGTTQTEDTMSLFVNPTAHAANPPTTWQVRKAGRAWQLTTADGVVLDRFERRGDAEAARTTGPIADLYAREGRWYAGESIPGWRPWADIQAEVMASVARLRAKADKEDGQGDTKRATELRARADRLAVANA